MVREIWSATDRTFLSSRAIFCPFHSLKAWKIQISIYKKNKTKSLEISSFYTSVPKFMIIGYTVPEILHVTDNFHFGLYFSLLASNSPKNEKFKTIKKTPGDIIILHRCTKNHDHMLYCLWDIVDDRCSCYFSFWLFFALLPP